MLGTSTAFSSFSTDSAARAVAFYRDTLGLDVEELDHPGAMLRLAFPGGGTVLIYEKEGHEPATHTVLMFPVEDVTATARALEAKGVTLEHLEWSDDDGVARDPDGRMPQTAWFKDPAGNWLSLLEDV